ncbi:NlpC/P60 family protein [Paenibacillus sp. BSR1-1]|uniref:C40 family peptidase n=1 Tax=Paenibacillus sp. BSR1-1 TaxID=3020845 RepID=UPI0025B25E6E|nr:C40 family peptidase [Paenibacillus sp. BSR1-1]MDN3017647.1 NlpC/P60 family protein [Paenibacillus sp. BSR1-1]
MIKKLLKYTLSAAVLASVIQVTPTFASPNDPPVTQGQIDETKGQIDDFETKIQQIDDRISLSMEKSQKLNADIKSQQGKIVETEADIEEAKKSLDNHKKVYSERLKSIQLEGKQSLAAYAELLLSSQNLSEFLTRFTAISTIMESDTALLNGLNQKEQELKNAEQKLHNELDQLKNSQAELASAQQKIEQDKQEIAKELAAAKNKLQNQQDQLAEQKAQQEAARQAALLAQQRAQQQQAQQAQQAQQTQQKAKQHTSVNKGSKTSTTASAAAVPASSGDASAVIAYAKQFLGVPYVWGGSTPSGFDCSGFTSYVFRNAAGINLPRVSRDQQNVGTRISPSQVQPGDLVFRGNPAYHVGIYIGNGQYIHAPQTGDVVKIAKYDPSKFSSAARVLR